MTSSRFLKAAAAALALIAASAHANVVTYTFTAAGANSGSFSFNDGATSIGNGPYANGGTAYAATSFIVDGLNQVTPELVLYPDYHGNQFAIFTTAAGSGDYLELSSAGTHTFASAAASQMDGKTLVSFDSGYLSIRGSVYQLKTLAQVTAVPEPGMYALLAAGLCGMSLFLRRRRG